MLTRKLALFVVSVLLTMTLAPGVRAQESLPGLIAPRYADMIFYNGPILTVDDAG